MNNLPAEHDEPVSSRPPASNPFAVMRDPNIAAGTVAIEEARAIAEAQGKLIVAKKFTRNPETAYAMVIASCKRPGFAGSAMYSFPRSGESIEGPTIRLAEELARAWGNIEFGVRELSQGNGVSEMEAYAWDMQTNVYSSQKFQVKHVRDTRAGQKKLTDARDIYELTANMAARRLRARILAILPPDMVDDAVAECKATMVRLASDDTSKRSLKMVDAFAKLGVTAGMIAERIGHGVEAITPEELVQLGSVHNSIRDHMSSVADWFGTNAKETPKLDALNEQVLGKAISDMVGQAPAGAPPAVKATDAGGADVGRLY